MDVSRRTALKFGVVGGAALFLPLERTVGADTATPPRLPSSKLPAPFTLPFSVPPVLAPVRSDATTDYYRITMAPLTQEVIPGFRTTFFAYNGAVPGPTIHVDQGRSTVVRQINSLPAKHPTLNYTPWTSVHLHGSPSLPQYDGYASDVSNPGQYKDYHYPSDEGARTLWYHDQRVAHTAENVYMGLAAQYHLRDPLERTLPIPHGDFEVPLTIRDAMFTSTGELLFDNHDGSGMWGDVIFVNGSPWPAMPVKRRKYRFRILNGSTSRSYNLFLDSGDPFAVIATDAGLMPHPVSARTLRMGMAERYEVVIDFNKYPVGRRIVLGNRNPNNNIVYPNIDKVMAFDVVGDDYDPTDNSVPDSLNPGNPTMALRVADAVRTRSFAFARDGGQFTINGHTWAEVVRSGFTFTEGNPRFGDTELWTFRNDSGGWFHPVHVHLVEFEVVDRNGRPPFDYENGPKDVVYLGEGDTVRVLIKFDQGHGRYMMHCHNTVHEDHDMMTQFEVTEPGVTPPSPFASPPLDLPEGQL